MVRRQLAGIQSMQHQNKTDIELEREFGMGDDQQ